MKKIIITIYVLKALRIGMALSIVIAMAGCSKQKSDKPFSQTQPAIKKLVRATYIYNNGSPENESFSYDVAGKLITYANDTREYSFDYSNSPTLYVKRKKIADGTIDQLIECTLNNAGAITKIVYKKTDGTVTGVSEYLYNTEGNVIREKSANAGYTYEEEYVIENGNAVSSKLYYDGVLYNNRFYYYDLSKANKAPFSYSGVWQSATLFGKPPKNVQTAYKDFDKNGTLTWHIQTIFETDADGYPVKMTKNFILQGTKTVADFSFQ